MTCKITFEPAGLYAKFSDIVTPEDLADLSDAMQLPQCAGFRYRIADYSDATDFHISGAHIAFLRPLEYLEDLNSPAILRVVVAEHPSIVSAFNEAQSGRDKPECSALFSNMADARRWLRMHAADR